MAECVTPAELAVTVTLKVPVGDRPERYPLPQPDRANRSVRAQNETSDALMLRRLRSGMKRSNAANDTNAPENGNLPARPLFWLTPVSRTKLRVSVAGERPERMTLGGEKTQAVSAGKPEHEKAIGWVKRLMGVNVT